MKDFIQHSGFVFSKPTMYCRNEVTLEKKMKSIVATSVTFLYYSLISLSDYSSSFVHTCTLLAKHEKVPHPAASISTRPCCIMWLLKIFPAFSCKTISLMGT